MKVSTIIFVIVFLLLVSGLVYMYYTFEKPVQETADDTINLNILALDEKQNKIETGYEIYIDDILFKNGTTLKYGSIQYTIPVNRSVKVVNINLKHQEFYKDYHTFISDINIPNVRVDFKLQTPGNIVLENSENLTDGNFFVTISSDNEIKNLASCIKWSSRIIYTKILNQQQIDKPERFINYDKCYSVNTSKIELEYTQIGSLENTDFIEIVVFDGEEIFDKIEYFEDIGAEDKVLIIFKK